MLPEGLSIEYKSLRKAVGAKKNLQGLAETCVCFANAQGGILTIGIEDESSAPPADQTVTESVLNGVVKQLRSLTHSVGILNPTIVNHANGGQYFTLYIPPSTRTIATTSSGKVLIRISDSCVPVPGDELTMLAAERGAFQWELVTIKNSSISELPPANIDRFVSEIKASPRVKESVKERADVEILEHYNFVIGNHLTNLGILWLGSPQMRARISYPLSLQYIVYDELGNKVRKESWHDYDMNPKEILIDLEAKATELNYYHEFPQGLLRQRIPHYRKEVVRELIVNALAHRSYTISADIYVRIFPDRLEVQSPGSLPLGISKDNILRKSGRRNPHLMKVFHDLELMEGEGTGYDLMYEYASRDSKPFPAVESSFTEVLVIQESRVLDETTAHIVDFICRHFTLTQQEMIVLGVIAREKKILATRLAEAVQLSDTDRLRTYVRRLRDEKIILKRGNRKGTEYVINPDLIRQSKINLSPSLKTVEPHVLAALIVEDLKVYPKSMIREIAARMEDVEFSELQRAVYKLKDEGILQHDTSLKTRKYWVAKKQTK